jgi:hypothetical protein
MQRIDKARSGSERRNFYLACVLCCAGYKLPNPRAEARRDVFVFLDRPYRRDNAMAFYGDVVTVSLQAFAATIKDMKGLLHNG